LKNLKLAPKTKGHIKGLMSLIFKCAQRWQVAENNPMDLVRVKDVSKRLERPYVLTTEEFLKLLPHIREPYHTMVLIAGCLGLRAGEIVGLQWSDFNFEKSILLVQRSIVHGRVGDTKKEYSRDSVPLVWFSETRSMSALPQNQPVFRSSTASQRGLEASGGHPTNPTSAKQRGCQFTDLRDGHGPRRKNAPQPNRQ
jgi:hypothetical protein